MYKCGYDIFCWQTQLCGNELGREKMTEEKKQFKIVKDSKVNLTKYTMESSKRKKKNTDCTCFSQGFNQSSLN